MTVEDYFDMIAGKTGALLAASPEIGAVIGGAAPEMVSATGVSAPRWVGRFSSATMRPGIWGDEAVTGKSAASDILSKKKSLPVLYALPRTVAGRFRPGPVVLPGQADKGGCSPRPRAARGRQARAYVEAQLDEATAEAHRALEETAPRCRVPHAALGELLDALETRTS